MEKLIGKMGKVEFGKYYNIKNKIITTLNETPILDSQKDQVVSINELNKLLDNEYIFNIIPHRNEIQIYQTNAVNLLSQYRFDIIVKYYYVKSYIENKEIDEAKKIYLSHIKAFNNFYEPDGRKKSAGDFIEKFEFLIENVKSCLYKCTKIKFIVSSKN